MKTPVEIKSALKKGKSFDRKKQTKFSLPLGTFRNKQSMKRFDLLFILVLGSHLFVEKGTCAPPTDVFIPLPTTLDLEEMSVYAFRNQNSYSAF